MEEEQELVKRPVCNTCGERIIEDYCWEINGVYICDDCMERDYRVETPVEED